jgi:hypothetical protein
MPIPTKGFFDIEPDQTTEKPPEPTDSIQHNQDRADAIRTQMEKDVEEQERKNEQYREQEQKRQDAAREQEVGRLQDMATLTRDQMTRDMLLDRIRAMRNEKPPEYVPPQRTPEQQKLLEAEMQAGREAVAKAEAALQERREAMARMNVTQEVVKTIQHPNPSQSEIFPTVKSTLPPKPRR